MHQDEDHCYYRFDDIVLRRGRHPGTPDHIYRVLPLIDSI